MLYKKIALLLLPSYISLLPAQSPLFENKSLAEHADGLWYAKEFSPIAFESLMIAAASYPSGGHQQDPITFNYAARTLYLFSSQRPMGIMLQNTMRFGLQQLYQSAVGRDIIFSVPWSVAWLLEVDALVSDRDTIHWFVDPYANLMPLYYGPACLIWTPDFLLHSSILFGSHFYLIKAHVGLKF